MKVILSPDARDYVKAEASYLMARSPRAALEFRDGLRRLQQELARFPQLGHPPDDLPFPGIRRFVVGSYLFDYEIRETTVVILAIRHGRQRPPGLEIDDDFDFED